MAPSSEALVESSTLAPPVASALPVWVRRPLPGVLAAFLILQVTRQVTNPDTFWHLAAGDYLLQHHSLIITPDPWSATASEPWILNQWLPELVMSFFQTWFGLPGVAWLLALWTLGAVAVVWIVCRAGASILVATLVTAATFVAMSGSISPRPQMFTFAFAALTTHAWLNTAEDRRARWWLIPLSWLWACCHGMWFLGPVIGVVVIVGMALDRRVPPREVARLVLVPLGMVAVAALTPVGPRLLLSPLQVEGITSYVSEWQPAQITDLPTMVLLALIAIPIIGAMRRYLADPWVGILLLGFALVLGLMQVRTVGVAAVIVAPLTARALHRMSGLPRERLSWPETTVSASLTVGALVVAALIAPTVAAAPGRVPTGLNPALDALPPGTVLCNNMEIGGWLIWRHPDLRVTFDQRVELYTPAFIDTYLTSFAVRSGWQNYLDETGCTRAVLGEDEPLVEALETRLDWVEVSRSDGMVLLRPPAG